MADRVEKRVERKRRRREKGNGVRIRTKRQKKRKNEDVKKERNFHYLFNTRPNIFRVTISRRMRWAGHVARMGERRGVYRVLVEET